MKKIKRTLSHLYKSITPSGSVVQKPQGRIDTRERNLATPLLRFVPPTSNYLEGEGIPVTMLPAEHAEYEIELSPHPRDIKIPKVVKQNRFSVPPGLPPGEYSLRVRSKAHNKAAWSPYSVRLNFTVHPKEANITQLRETDHILDLMLEHGMGKTTTLVDPDSLPPNAMHLKKRKWFATPYYEGVPWALNEEEAYYRDPLAYYLNCIDLLLKKDVKFITWNDIINATWDKTRISVLLQFDVDGGPHSMHSLYTQLRRRKIIATMMVHRRGHQWYPYKLEDVGLPWLQEAEKTGWMIGYHNNSLSQCANDVNKQDLYNAEVLKKAEGIFVSDVNALRKWFTITTYTNHGGNVYNSKIRPSKDLEVLNVDKYENPEVWKDVNTMFSDGGFVARPMTMQKRVETLEAGVHFFRNHPFKYGNYQKGFDIPPRNAAELKVAGIRNTSQVQAQIKKELEKEKTWILHRQRTRAITRLNYWRLEKPISEKFAPFSRVEKRINKVRKVRRPSFLRLYPWAQGDPRMFWLRMLEAWAPKSGKILNVGALPPDQKEQIQMFLSPKVVIEDMDIDAARKPTYHMDIVEAPETMNNVYDAVLLFGLPCFSSPSKAVDSSLRVTRKGGVGLFGFAADTSPTRGSLWSPHNRTLWRPEKEPMSEGGNLWAFDEECLEGLFLPWPSVKFEFIGHYWFAVGRKPNK